VIQPRNPVQQAATSANGHLNHSQNGHSQQNGHSHQGKVLMSH
jgi:hypothetical protein